MSPFRILIKHDIQQRERRKKETPRSEPYCFVLQRSHFWTGEGKKKEPLLNNSQLAMILSRQFTTEGDREKPSPTSSSTLVKPTTIHGQSTQVKSSHSTSKFFFYLCLNILELSTRLLQFSSSLLISDLWIPEKKNSLPAALKSGVLTIAVK
jgi:hypothetical protein